MKISLASGAREFTLFQNQHFHIVFSEISQGTFRSPRLVYTWFFSIHLDPIILAIYADSLKKTACTREINYG